MTGGSGVDGIIHHAAGNELYDACKAHKQISRGVRLPTGHSRILLSYNMSPMPYYIINTAGPMYSSYKAKQCAEELSSCYQTSLALANLYDLESIGFTAISCGIFGYVSSKSFLYDYKECYIL
jgi:O-acetyl-ADP-ribose deacetylase (regulator of RNase III)